MVVTDVENTERESCHESLEYFSKEACQAEANEDYEAADDLLRQALQCDAKLHLNVTNA